MNPQIKLGRNYILKILRLLNHKHELSLHLFSSLISLSEFCNFSTETTLFGVEIQKSISFLPIYLSRFLINAGYDSVYPTISTEDSRHQVFTKVKMIFSPINGNLSRFQFNLGFDMYYQIDEDKFSFSLGGILDL